MALTPTFYDPIWQPRKRHEFRSATCRDGRPNVNLIDAIRVTCAAIASCNCASCSVLTGLAVRPWSR
jgi:hypothetical protein